MQVYCTVCEQDVEVNGQYLVMHDVFKGYRETGSDTFTEYGMCPNSNKRVHSVKLNKARNVLTNTNLQSK